MRSHKTPIAKQSVLLRQEFDDWAILFDPDTGDAFCLNPIGVLIWKLLDGQNTIQDILKKLLETCTNVPEEASSHLENFLQDLIEKGFASYENPGN